MFTHYCGLPLPKPKEGQAQDRFATMNRLRGRELKRLIACFGVPYEENGFNVGDFEKATATCKVVVDERGEAKFNKLQPPYLKEGEDAGSGDRGKDSKPTGRLSRTRRAA